MSEILVDDLYEGNPDRFKKFLKSILSITIPIVLQNVVTISLGMLDIVMLGHMGTTEASTINVAAASQGHRSFFVIFLVFFGFAAGASIFFSQFFGKKDFQGIRKTLGLVLVIGFIASLFPFFWSILIPKTVMGLFINKDDVQVLTLGAQFISIFGLSLPFMVISMVYSFALRSVGNATVPMMASIAALSCNAIINYFLIYGVGPIPAMGVKGAAIGTLVARILEFVITLSYIYTRKEHPLKASFKELFNFKWLDVKKYFSISSYVIIEEGLWGAAMTTQFAILGYMGRTTAAASSIIGPFVELSLIMFFAISQGASIIIGNMIGAGKSEKEIKWVSWKSIQLSFSLSILVAVIFGVIPYHLLPYMYDVDQDVLLLAQKTLVFFAFFLLIRGVELVGSIGVLRGAGDTLFTMFLNVLGAWFIMVPIVYIGGVVLKLPMYQVIGYSFIYELTVGIFVFFRIRGNSWIKDLAH